MDDLISALLDAGLDISDLKNLEKLSDKNVLAKFPKGERNLLHNRKEDVASYLLAWSELLEEKLAEQVEINDAFTINTKLV